MRANSLNLKKKIAFIASLAMIAGTAAYLPANIAQNLGFGNSIIASATDPSTNISTFDAFVKVNGKYLITDGTDYKTASSIANLETGWVVCVLSEGVSSSADATNLVNGKYFGIGGIVEDESTPTANTFEANGTVPGTTDTIALPNTVAGGATVTVEVVARTGAAVKTSTTDYSVTLDENGEAEFKTNAKVSAASDATVYNADGTVKTGNYETVNLKGLKFAVSAKTADKVEGLRKDVSALNTNTDAAGFNTLADTTSVAINGVSSQVLPGATTDIAIADVKQAEVGGKKVYANIIKVTAKAAVAPSTQVKAKANIASNWTASKKEFTLTFGEEGYAESEAFSVTKSGSDAEYYIIRVVNPAGALGAAQAGKLITFDDAAAADVIKGDCNNETDDSSVDFTSESFKVEKSTQVIDGEYVTVYTVYHNAKDTEYFTLGNLTTGHTNAKIYTTANTTDTTEATDAAKTGATGATASSGLFVNCMNSSNVGTGKGESAVLYYDEDGATATYGREAFKVVFTTDYEIKVDYNNEDEDAAEHTTKVTDGCKVVKPSEDPVKAGATFNGWKVNTTFIYRAGSSSVQQDEASITPNVVLTADFTDNKYDIDFDANGGYFGNGINISALSIKTMGDKAGQYLVMTTAAKTDASGDWALVGTTVGVNTLVTTPANDYIVRPGYTFKGWAAKADATEADVLTEETMKTVRPDSTSSEAVKLYAVWVANDVTVSLGTIGIDSFGESYTGTCKDSEITLKNATYLATVPKNKNGNNVTKGIVKTDSEFGTLPTPSLLGYTFEGWYRQKINGTSASTKSYVLEKVDADTVLSSDWFIDPTTNAVVTDGDSAIKLYAKFKQDINTVTFDLDGGTWGSSTFKAPVKFKINQTTEASIDKTSADNDLAKNAENQIMFIDEDGTEVAATKLTAGDANVPNNGSFYTFNGWNFGKKTAVAGDKLKEEILKLTDVSDLTIKANWQAKNDGTGAFNLMVNADDAHIYQNLGTSENARYVLADTASGAVDLNGDGDEADAGESGTTKLDIAGVSGKSVSFKFNGNEIKTQDNKTYVVARPGYSFGGWYTDAECTTEADLTKYPKDTQVKVYAKWTPKATTRYKLRYNLVTADDTIIAPTSVDDNYTAAGGDYKFLTEKMGVTGETKDASELSFNYKEKKYVFDSTLSASLKYKDEIATSFNNLVVGTGNNAVTLTDVYDLNSTSADTTLYAYYKDESAVTPEEKTLGTVNDVTVDDNGKVTWSAAENAVKYKVVKTVGTSKGYSGWLTETSYEFKNAPKETYKVRVVAEDAKGNQTWGKEITVTPKVDENALGKVDAATIKVAADRKTVTWTAAANAAKYKLVKTVNGKKYYSSEVTTNTYTFNTATQDAFTVKVVAISADGEEKTWSDAVTVDKSATTLGKVVNPTVEGKKVTWTAVEGATKYKAFKVIKNSTGKDTTYGGSETTNTTYTFGSLPATDYKVYVVAYAGDVTSVGTAVKVSDAPKVTGVTVSADGKTVTWTKADGAAKYQVKKSVGNQSFYTGKTENASIKLSTALKPGEYVQVVSFDADGCSTYSDAVTLG